MYKTLKQEEGTRRLELRGKTAEELGLFAVVDADLYDWLNQWKWSARKSSNGKTFYAWRNNDYVNGKQGPRVFMHRQIMAVSAGLEVHHTDDNGLHNWRGNLAAMTHMKHRRLHRKLHFAEYWTPRKRKAASAAGRISGKKGGRPRRIAA